MQSYTRDDLLALTPDRYLHGGWEQRELTAEYATAACAQLAAAGLPPQELGFTLEAIKLLLPEHDDAPTPHAQLREAVDEALLTVARAIQQPNNEGLLKWLSECTAHVRTDADVQAFLAHMTVVNRQYAVSVALMPLDTQSSSQSASA